jgi:thymidylate synthase (FAD)
MPHNVEIEVHMIAKTQVERAEAEDWLERVGVSDEGIDRLVDGKKSSAELLVELAGRRCYKSFEVGLNPNVSKIREDIGVYIDNILASGHGSVLEHVNFTFAIEGVSRVFTGEMNRHRAGTAISEASMRYIRYDDIGYWLPTSIHICKEDIEGSVTSGVACHTPLGAKKEQSQKIFDDVFSYVEKKYAELCGVWKDELAPDSKFKAKKEITSMMRRIIPMGVATGGVWTGNIRALRHIFGMRCSPAAEEEILLVATKMLSIMRQQEPCFFGDYTTDEATGYSKPKHWKV